MECGYRLEIPPFAMSAAGVVFQIRAGNQPIRLTVVRLNQTSKLTSENLRFQWTRKTTAAVVNQTAPSRLHPNAPDSGAARTETGYYKASGGTLGADGDGLGYVGWNVVNGQTDDLFLPADQIEIPAGGTVALNLITPPSAAMSFAGYVAYVETF